MSILDQLRTMTTVVADTGDINAIAQHRPQDATTNPSLIAKAAQQPEYADLIHDAVAFGRQQSGDSAARLEATLDKLFVNFGVKILGIIPGRVSTEVDARLSFDLHGSLNKAHRLIRLYEDAGIGRERILIKLASTWEGMRVAELLERESIHTNMTLMFCLCQAVAAAKVNATLISPFVGRIYDWYCKDKGVKDIPIADDPGVSSVREIHTYLKKFGHPVQVMGASFRKADQIVALAGCDLLTIAPDLLVELQQREGKLVRALDANAARSADVKHIDIDEPTFRWMLNEDAMATEKLADGIRRFNADLNKLRQQVAKQLTHA
ncbi:MAG: transaldolase [Phycisphaeraceae bacterium]